jgi:hypothetical protein
MTSLKRLWERVLSRRNFLKGSLYIASGALCCSHRLFNKEQALASTPGITGNRVVWVHDKYATFWDGSGYYGDYVN